MSASMGELFARKRTFEKTVINNNELCHDEKLGKHKSAQQVCDGRLVWFTFICVNCAIVLLARHRFYLFPDPKSQLSESPLDEFYETNARIHLEDLLLHGPRVVGSESNELFAHNYLLKQVNIIKHNCLHSQNLEIDVQNASGSFDLAFLSDFVSIYRNIKNIIVKLDGKPEGSDHSLLMSCHFDSAVDSPGAGDNAISCAVMLEVLRAFSQSMERPLHNIIFLFNGAEENILQASHGFITKHPWAQSIRAFVNIDSAGAGGKEILFQTGPENPWLVRAYAQSVPYPSGAVTGQEIFQSGLIPSDTDYRIYRDFGELPGLDLAYISNGYVYHTQNDQYRFIQPGCVQRGGENLLSLLRHLASSPRLADPGADRHGTMVFFDLLGVVMVYYPQRVGVVINCALVAAVLVKVLRKIFYMDSSDIRGMDYVRSISAAIVCMFVTWVVIIVTCVAMAMVVTLLGVNMFWFTNCVSMVPIYTLPALTAALILHEVVLKSRMYSNKSGWQVESLYFEANLIIWSCFTLLATLYGLGSAYFPMLYVIGPLLIRDRTLQWFRTWNYRDEPTKFLCLHLVSIFLPLLMTLYVIFATLVLMVPIMARSGSEVNPDIVISILNAFLVIFSSTYMISFIYICRCTRKVIYVLLAISAVWFLLILTTPLGFPYGGDPQQPTPLRLLTQHVDRRKYDRQGTMTNEDSGLWYIPFDYTREQHLLSSMPMLKDGQKIDCSFGPYCGMPWFLPMLTAIHPRYHLYIPAASHNLPPVRCTLMDTRVDPSAVTRMSFEVTGPDHCSMTVRPRAGVTLERWSLTPLPPQPAHMPPDINETTYFVYYSHGETPATPWTFSLYFKVPKEYPDGISIVDLGFAGQYLHGKNKQSKQLSEYLATAPDWTTPVTWSATWDGYEF